MFLTKLVDCANRDVLTICGCFTTKFAPDNYAEVMLHLPKYSRSPLIVPGALRLQCGSGGERTGSVETTLFYKGFVQDNGKTSEEGLPSKPSRAVRTQRRASALEAAVSTTTQSLARVSPSLVPAMSCLPPRCLR